ncbi:MAG TPA: hypothetical protein VGM17_17030 [Rhizomicrobium sp.]
MQQLGDRFDIHGLGFRPGRGPAPQTGELAGWPLHVQPTSHVFVADPAWLCGHMQTVAPHAALVIGPAVLAAPLLRQLQPYRARCRLVLYLPVEGELTNADITQTLQLADGCVLYTNHAKRNVASLCDASGCRSPLLGVAGHGIDTRCFFPLDAQGRGAVRRRLFPNHAALHDAFLVLNVNRAYQRKRLDLTIAGFARFARERPDAWLYLHVCALSRHEDAAVRGWIAQSCVGGRILLNALNPDGTLLDIEQLNLLYNASDVGVTTAMGEGWGLGTFEHAATGAAQIVPDHTSFRENWQGAAELLPPVAREHIFYEFADMFVVSPDDVAASLARLHADAVYRRRMADAAFRRATEPRFRWNAVADSVAAFLWNVIEAPSCNAGALESALLPGPTVPISALRG